MGAVMDDRERIESAKWVFERTLGWIATADVKVGVAVAIDTAMVGGLAAAYSASPAAVRTTACVFAVLCAGGGLVVALFCAGMAAIPRMLGPAKSHIFFARISAYRLDEYLLAVSQDSEKDFLLDLSTQIHRNSQIATAKHAWVRKSLLWSFFSVVPWLVAVGLLVRA